MVDDEDFQKMVREKLLGVMAKDGNKQKVVLDRVPLPPANEPRRIVWRLETNVYQNHDHLDQCWNSK